MSILSFYAGIKPARRSILEMFNIFYSLYEPPEQPLETGVRARQPKIQIYWNLEPHFFISARA